LFGDTLVDSSQTAATPDAALYLHPQTLARLRSFELRAKHIVEGVQSGMHRSPYFGFSVEFAQHRPYAPGDDLRHLDWKVFGRTNKLHLKQYEQETNLDVVVMVDASGSMNFGSLRFKEMSGAGVETSLDGRSNWTKFDHATALAAAISYLAIKQGDRVGLTVYADEVHAILRRSGAKAQWRLIIEALATQPVKETTNLGRAVDQTLARVGARGLFVIISDFFEDTENIRAALARIRHKGSDAILMQVVDPLEASFDLRDTAPFVGLEGEARLRLDPRTIRKEYLAAFNRHSKELKRVARSLGFDEIRISTNDWLGPPLAAFLGRRNARLKRRKSS